MNELLNYKNTSFIALNFVKSQSKIELFDYNFDQTNYISLMILDLMSKGQYGSLINQFTDEEVENIEKQIKDNTFVYEIPDPELSKMREISLEVFCGSLEYRSSLSTIPASMHFSRFSSFCVEFIIIFKSFIKIIHFGIKTSNI